ncbi:hypothetical protein [Streptomyces cacaoi]|uniref:hypothetical protein n=1 Tax=Streptomyces cacaoi TaxID=1898 RepID=UPI001FD5D263|nr:hypothetical protein [Streptomyces cacaoi]
MRPRLGALASVGRSLVAPVALTAVGYLLQVVGVLAGAVWAVVGGAVLGALTEVLFLRRARRVARQMARAQFTLPVRQLVRDGLLLGGLARLDVLRADGTGAWLLLGVLGCWALHFLCQAVAGAVRARRRLPVVTRNIDATGLGVNRAPPSLFAQRGGARLAAVGLLLTAGMAVSAGTGGPAGALAAVSLCALVLLAGTAYLAGWLLPHRRVADEDAAMAWLDAWLAEYRPTVGLYFSGGPASAYQADMWLTTLAQLDERPLIVLRERFMVQKLEATDLPILCLPKVAHLMRLEHSGLKVLLHPSNSGKTSQVLRIPSIKHAFINHGESDKLSSCNPYAKAYDQVWVAGEAARERYQLAEVGVDDRDVVEVGRPQLAPIEPYAGPPTGPYTTVLYAPTWEGWDGNPGNTSVVLAGENIVRALLADPGVRLLYKPHPMTGSVDPRAGAADHRIRAMIEQADVGRNAQAADPEARAALERAARRLDALAGPGEGADEVELMLRQGPPEPGRAAAREEAVRAWEAAYWAGAPPGAHRVVTGPRPSLFSCFNQADLLISDVSSVVSDHLSSEKPYAVANTSGMTEEEFRAAFPTVRAATVLGPDGAGVPGLLRTVRAPGPDPLAPARAALKVRLLGPAEPPSLVRFGRAVRALAAQAEARQRRAEAREPLP